MEHKRQLSMGAAVHPGLRIRVIATHSTKVQIAGRYRHQQRDLLRMTASMPGMQTHMVAVHNYIQ